MGDGEANTKFGFHRMMIAFQSECQQASPTWVKAIDQKHWSRHIFRQAIKVLQKQYGRYYDYLSQGV